MQTPHPWWQFIGFDENSPAPTPGNPDPSPAPTNAPAPNPAPPAPKTYTEAEFNQHMAGLRRTQRLEMARELGFNSVEDMQTAAKAHQDRLDAEKTEAQRAKDAEAAAKKSQQDAEVRAQRAELKLTVTSALLGTGVRSDRATRAATLLLAELPADADESAVKSAADKLKTEMPELFGRAGTPDSDHHGAPPGGQATKTGYDAGAQRARAEIEKRGERQSWLTTANVIGR